MLIQGQCYEATKPLFLTSVLEAKKILKNIFVFCKKRNETIIDFYFTTQFFNICPPWNFNGM